MIRKWNYTDNVYYQSRQVAFPKTPEQLPEEVRRKMQTRVIYFLTEQQIVLLRGEELKVYLRKVWYWLVVNQHVGPLWLSAVIRTLYSEVLYGRVEQIEKTPITDLAPDLQALARQLQAQLP